MPPTSLNVIIPNSHFGSSLLSPKIPEKFSHQHEPFLLPKMLSSTLSIPDTAPAKYVEPHLLQLTGAKGFLPYAPYTE